MTLRVVTLLPLLIGVLTCASSSLAQDPSVGPISSDPSIAIRHLAEVEANAIRIEFTRDALYYVTIGGDIWRVDRESGAQELVATAADHGLTNVWGFATTVYGRFYLVSNDQNGVETQATIKRGVIQGNEVIPGSWETLAETERYPEAGAAFDHVFNAIVPSPDGNWVYLNSGSRTDHGEIQDNEGRFPDLREIPLTSTILRLPADTTDLLLLNNRGFLVDNGFLWADGLRNTFDLAFNHKGELFGTENSGDRDDSDELNWIRPGHHYGFPWRIGLTDTPQQFPDYDPSSDVAIGPGASAPFSNDPTYPPPPDGIEFTDPVLSSGPDADKYRNPSDGTLLDASDEGTRIGTFTAHRSPLGLTFDEGNLNAPYHQDGFALSWTDGNSALLGPMMDAGQELLHISLTYDEREDQYEAKVAAIVRGFTHPIDAVLVQNHMYVLELGFGVKSNLWEIVLPLWIFPATEDNQVSTRAVVVSAYPNPFRGDATLVVELARSDYVGIDMIDISGKTVRTFGSRWLASGSHEFALSDLPSGLYLIRARTNSATFKTLVASIR